MQPVPLLWQPEGCPVTTSTICAPGATAPDHSTSSVFSSISFWLQVPLVLMHWMAVVPAVWVSICCGVNPAGREKAVRNAATSEAAIRLVPAMAIVWPVPSIGVPACHSGSTLYMVAKSHGETSSTRYVLLPEPPL